MMKNSLYRRLGTRVNRALERFNLEITLSTVNKRPKLKRKYRDYDGLSVLPKVPTIIEVATRIKDTDSIKRHFPNAKYHFINPSHITAKKNEEADKSPGNQLEFRGLELALSERDFKAPYGVRIDAPGHEREIIKVLNKIFDDAVFIIVEYHFGAAIRNEYILHDLVKMVEVKGFSAYLIQKDGSGIVFLKRDNAH